MKIHSCIFFQQYTFIYIYFIVTNIVIIIRSHQTSVKCAFFVHKFAHNAHIKKHVLCSCSLAQFQHSTDISVAAGTKQMDSVTVLQVKLDDGSSPFWTSSLCILWKTVELHLNTSLIWNFFCIHTLSFKIMKGTDSAFNNC